MTRPTYDATDAPRWPRAIGGITTNGTGPCECDHCTWLRTQAAKPGFPFTYYPTVEAK
jgi:hypothetical protein